MLYQIAETGDLFRRAPNNNQIAAYTYDADGRRVKRSVAGQPSAVETWQAYGIGGELLAEYAANASPASPQKEYGYRNGQLLITAEASGTTGSTTENVSWTNAVGVSTSGNSMTKTAATGWGNAGAASVQSIVSGDGYVEFTATETNTDRICGLSHGDANQDWTDIDYGLYLRGDGVASIGEAGVYRSTITVAYATGDHLRVAVEGGVVKYKKNGTVFYTSTISPSYPLLADTSLYTASATIGSVVLSGNLNPNTQNVGWVNNAGVSLSGNSLAKTASTNWANAGASSSQSIVSGDGYVEFTATETNTDRICGLSNGDTNQDWTDIDFGLYLRGDGVASIGEGGVYRSTITVAYATGDHLRVAVEGGVVKYEKNGTVFYTSPVTPTYPLLVDTSLYTNGATLTNVVISGNLSVGSGGSGANINWLVTDQLGTPRMIFDQSGALATTKRHDYLPFGEEVFNGARTSSMGYASNDTTRQKFTQKERDNETGLDYFLARYYSSTQGRFTGVDPVMMTEDRLYDPQQIGLYVYCRNNPLAFIDPTGETISFRDGDLDSQRAFNEYETFINKNPNKYRKEIATIKQLRASDVNYIVILGGKQKSETAEGNTVPDKKGENVLVQIRNVGGPQGEKLDRNGRFAHELEHARQFDSGEIAFVRSQDGTWSPIGYDIYDEVNAYNATVRVAPPVKDTQLLRNLRDDRISDSDRARYLISNGYSGLKNSQQPSNIDRAWGAKPGELVRPAANRPFFGRVYDPSRGQKR